MAKMLFTVYLILFISTVKCANITVGDRLCNFSLELVHHTAKYTNNHIIISPFGVWSLLTGVALGATGETWDQIRHALFLPSTEKTLINSYKNITTAVLNRGNQDVMLSSKNYMFLDKNFQVNMNFKNKILTDFNAMIKVLDFKDSNTAAQTANQHINNSGGKFSNVLTSPDFEDSKMILTNVISFKGLWGLPFNKTDTNVEPFYDENKKVIGSVNMMYQRGEFKFSSITDLNGIVLELPYGTDGKYSMLFAIPRPTSSVAEMYKNFAKVSLKDILKQLVEDSEAYGEVNVDVKVPKFKISTSIALNKPLIDMGVTDMFEPNLASFEKVSTDKIFVSTIVHKADIEVTESGTVASAVTSAFFADRITPPSFHANRPFVYFVIEKTSPTIIFGGIYSQPSVY